MVTIQTAGKLLSNLGRGDNFLHPARQARSSRPYKLSTDVPPPVVTIIQETVVVSGKLQPEGECAELFTCIC